MQNSLPSSSIRSVYASARSTSIIALFALTFFISNLHSQDTTRNKRDGASHDEEKDSNWTYNCLTGSFSITEKGAPEIGSTITITINNINPFLYDVSVNAESQSYNVQVPNMLSKAFEGVTPSGPAISASGSRAAQSINEQKEVDTNDLANIINSLILPELDTINQVSQLGEWTSTIIKQPYVDEKKFKDDLEIKLEKLQLDESPTGTKFAAIGEKARIKIKHY